MIDAGISVVVAAGNANVDACLDTPASAPNAITAAAVTASFTEPAWTGGQSTNYGKCVDLYAPGDKVVVADAKNMPSGQAAADGTSFSSPLIAGAAAQVLADHPTWTPAQVAADLDEPRHVRTGERPAHLLRDGDPLDLREPELQPDPQQGPQRRTARYVRRHDADDRRRLRGRRRPCTAVTLTGLPPRSRPDVPVVPRRRAHPGRDREPRTRRPSDEGKSLTVTVTGRLPRATSTTSATSVGDGGRTRPPPAPGMVTIPTRRLGSWTPDPGSTRPGRCVNGRTVILPVPGVAGVRGTPPPCS